MRQEIQDAVDAVRAVLKREPHGGYLHCYISDGNLSTLPFVEDINGLRKEVNPETGKPYAQSLIRRYRNCVMALEKLTEDGREFACHLAHDHDKWGWIEEYERLYGAGSFDECDLVQ